MNKEHVKEELAPIAVFAYNRLDKIQQTIECLKNNTLASDSYIYIFCDGPKDESDAIEVARVREYLSTIEGFKRIHIVNRKKNIGLASSIISGVSKIIDKYGKIIVVEDDILTSRFFLEYMNNGLNDYSDNSSVMAISGYSAPYNKSNLPDFYFLPYFACWGWATWKDSWEKFVRDPKQLILSATITDIYRINISGSSPDMWEQVVDNYRKKIRTWAIFFHSIICINGGLVLFPKCSLCSNIGFDGSGTNCEKTKLFDLKLDEKDSLPKLPCDVRSNPIAYKRLIDFNNKRIKFNDRLYYFALRIVFNRFILLTVLKVRKIKKGILYKYENKRLHKIATTK